MMLIINFLLFISLFFAPPAHPVHVALTSIEYRNENREFNVAFKIFWDDLEKVIAEKYNVGLKLAKSDKNPEEEKLLDKYIGENFRFVVNEDREIQLVYDHKKINETAIWLYFKGSWSGPVQKVYIYNTVMMDMFGDQTDLVIFKYGTFERGILLNTKHYEINLKLK
ncbi:MAG TPA: hypothetical protein ENK25_00770 [Bacteroidetes bacterium]|nr:hypothetical protein [Bacteroidota bacterium]